MAQDASVVVPASLLARADAAAALLRQASLVTVAHHIDADGVAAGAAALTALQRAGITATPMACKSLDAAHLERIQQAVQAAGDGHVTWFCDFGSTAYMLVPGDKVVCDHHELVRDGTQEEFPHVNPLLDELPGDSISGAGCAYLVAAALDAANTDLRPLALVGATADLQDRRDGHLHGANAAILAEAEAAGQATTGYDLAWFGIETRPLDKFFRFADPAIPGLADGRAAEALANRIGISWTAPGGATRTWNGLDDDERRRLRSAVVDHALDVGWSAEQVAGLWRRVITFPGEVPGAPVREAQSFATLLNSTARYERPEVGLAVAAGDRDVAYREAMDLLSGHRRHLVGALGALRERTITPLRGIQWVHLQDAVKDTVVGIVCGMAVGGSVPLRGDLALVGLAYTDGDMTKVSGRANQSLQDAGIDLATAMRAAAGAVGGVGGGHKGAAGATTPREREADFIAALDEAVAEQLGRHHRTEPSSATPAAGQQTVG